MKNIIIQIVERIMLSLLIVDVLLTKLNVIWNEYLIRGSWETVSIAKQIRENKSRWIGMLKERRKIKLLLRYSSST